MKKTINLQDFINEFRGSMYSSGYTDSALEVIFDELEMIEDGTDSEIELDVVAIACDYTEYTEDQLTNDFGLDQTFKNMSESLEEHVIGYTDCNTVVIRAH